VFVATAAGEANLVMALVGRWAATAAGQHKISRMTNWYIHRRAEV
jgi:hypothetical protein